MTDTPKNDRGPAAKLTILGVFVVVIALISWASIKIINVMPEAFSSLASLAESIQSESHENLEGESEKTTEITIASDVAVVNSGESVNVSWSASDQPGNYTFSYECNRGVVMSMIEGQNLNCGTDYDLGDVQNIELIIESEQIPMVDIGYTIAFSNIENGEKSISSASLMVVNSELDDETTTEDESVVEEVVVEENSSATNETETVEQQFVYQVPVSDPDGFTDLSVRFIATGNIVGNTFFAEELVAEDGGAIQFEVKNYGTKTSEEWEFSVALPNGGTYESGDQEPLKPNERAVLTIGFTGTEESQHVFSVEIDTDGDANSANNDFSETIVFVNI